MRRQGAHGERLAFPEPSEVSRRATEPEKESQTSQAVRGPGGGRVVVRVQAVEDWAGDGHGVLVVADHGQATQGDVEAGGFGGVEAFVVQVGFVDDFGDALQGEVVGELIAAQDGLKGAVALVVSQFHAAHVERCGVAGDLVGIGDEDEGGVRVDEAADQPGAGGAVDVDAGAGGPPHADSLSSVLFVLSSRSRSG